MPVITIPGAKKRTATSQCQMPRGRVGDAVLDVGCGGGRTVAKLADAAPTGIVHGIDYAQASVDVARRINRHAVSRGRVVIQKASVAELPFDDHMFDLVTAVETHFWWQDLGVGMREVFRVLKPADRIARYTSMAVLDIGQHRALFDVAGFADVRVDEQLANGWLCVVGTKPS